MATKKTSPATPIKKSASGKPAAKAKSAAKATPPAKAKPAAKAKTAAKAAKAKPAAKASATKAPAKTKTARKAAPAAKKTPQGPAIVHWEIQSKQPEALHGFYSEVFGWKIDANNPMKYGMVSSKGANGGIDGGIGGSEDESARVLVYASVPSIAETLNVIEELGGRTIMPRTDIGPVVMAIYLDPEGNAMGLIEDR
jgi:predicted enzyme related to lactoylglutathione lyase